MEVVCVGIAPNQVKTGQQVPDDRPVKDLSKIHPPPHPPSQKYFSYPLDF